MSFERIKEALPASDVLTHFLGRPRTRRFLCPFHPDKNPSMTEKDGGIVCWACGWKGDLFRFLENYLSVDRGQSLRIAADLAGVTLPRKDDKTPPRLPTMMATLERIRRESRQIEREILWEAKRAAAQAWRQAWEHRDTEEVWETVAIGVALDRQVDLLQVSHG